MNVCVTSPSPSYVYKLDIPCLLSSSPPMNDLHVAYFGTDHLFLLPQLYLFFPKSMV